MSTPISPTLLPPGYTLVAPGTVMEQTASGLVPRPDLAPRVVFDQPATKDGVPGYALYGGATGGEAWDAVGTHYLACDAKGADGVFLFYAFNLDTGQSIPLQQRCTGRGSVVVNQFTGVLWWYAWDGAYYFDDVLPGAIPFAPAGGGYTQAPGGYTRVFKQEGFAGDMLLHLPSLGVPVAREYDLSLSLDGDRAGLQLRAGPKMSDPNLQDGVMIKVATYAAGSENRAFERGYVAGSADGMLLIRAANGTTAHAYVDVMAWRS